MENNNRNNNLINARIVYKDVNTNQPVYSRGISGHPNDPVHLEQYKKYVPNNYQFEGYGHFSRYLKANDVDVIYIKRGQNKSVKKGHILVNYVGADDQLVNRNTFTNQVGASFNINRCRATIPKDYKFDKVLMGRNIKSFKNQSQIMVVQVSRVHHANITMRYMNQNQQIGQISAKGVVGTNFDISQYIHNVPKGYQFVDIVGNVPKTFQHNQTVKINVTKIQQRKEGYASRTSNGHGQTNTDQYDSERVGQILMKLASSLHALGETISKNHKI